MGAWFPKDKGGGYSNLWANGENPNVKGKTSQAVNYPFCLLCPIIYFFQKLVEVVNAWGWEEYGNQIRIWESISFLKTHFWLMGQVNAQKCFPFHYAFMSFISSHMWSLLSSLLHVFYNYVHCYGWENPFFLLLSECATKIHDLGVQRGRFCLPRTLGACCVFPSRFYVVSSFSPCPETRFWYA